MFMNVSWALQACTKAFAAFRGLSPHVVHMSDRGSLPKEDIFVLGNIRWRLVTTVLDVKGA